MLFISGNRHLKFGDSRDQSFLADGLIVDLSNVLTLECARPHDGVACTPYHTKSEKRPIDLLDELNIKKETPRCVTKIAGYELDGAPEMDRARPYFNVILLSEDPPSLTGFKIREFIAPPRVLLSIKRAPVATRR